MLHPPWCPYLNLVIAISKYFSYIVSTNTSQNVLSTAHEAWRALSLARAELAFFPETNYKRFYLIMVMSFQVLKVLFLFLLLFYLYACLPHVYLVPKEASEGGRVLRICKYRWLLATLCMLGIGPQSSGRATWAISLALVLFTEAGSYCASLAGQEQSSDCLCCLSTGSKCEPPCPPINPSF